MPTTLLRRSKDATGRDEATRALRAAGVGVEEIDDWNEAAAKLRECGAALLLSESELERAGAARLAKAASALASAAPASGLAPEAARALSHELRTPLSAMAGWVHLMETGKLDEQGIKRALERLRGNIDDQVRTIERYLGATNEGHRE